MIHVLARGRSFAAVLFVGALLIVSPAQATIVRFDTVVGAIDVRLYDSATPLTVANFLNYTLDQRYDGTFIHRKVYDFVVQGGGFYFDEETYSAPGVETFPPVQNEPGISNKRGTIAMAKLGGDPDSATSQWYFNVLDNGGSPSGGLDYDNGGYTVFGRVVGTGMCVIDEINTLYEADLDGDELFLFDNVPIRNGATSLSDGLVFVNSVTVRNLAAGDYDFNGVVDELDYDVWKSTFGSTTAADADGNGDGIVDAVDYGVWRNCLTGTVGLPGDFDGNGLVNESDFGKWRADFGTSVAAGTGADGNGNGFVDAADYTLWRDSMAAGSGAALLTMTIPEPAAAALLLSGGGALLAVVRRRRPR